MKADMPRVVFFSFQQSCCGISCRIRLWDAAVAVALVGASAAAATAAGARLSSPFELQR